MLMLPLLITYLFQATQYARAPIKYNFYVVYAKNADIALQPGSDLSPNGLTLLQNASTQEGLYNLTLGQWGPGYRINYTDAFHIKSSEAFGVGLISLNYSTDSTGNNYLAIYVRNDTDGDGVADGPWIAAWLGSDTWPPANGNQLNASYFIYLAASMAEYIPVKIEIKIPETGIAIGPGTPVLPYTGTLYLWFTSKY
jgi:hypothetical protein